MGARNLHIEINGKVKEAMSLKIIAPLTFALIIFVAAGSYFYLGADKEEDIVEVDEIVLKSGERFVGKIIRRGDKSIIFKPIVVGNIDPDFTFSYDDIYNIVPGYSEKTAIEKNPLLDAFVEKKEYQKLVYQWYQDKNYKKLEQEVSELLKTKLRTKSGRWKLDLFYQAIARYYTNKSLRQLENHFKRLEEWQNLFQQSNAPVILQLLAYKEIAWYHRGGGFSGSISRSGRQEFESNMLKAQALIDRQLSITDPRFYPAATAVSKAVGNFNEARQKWLNAANEYDIQYEMIYTTIANYLVKRWGGNKNELENFADHAAKVSGTDEIYLRIAHRIAHGIDISGYRNYQFDWDRIKSGYRVHLENYSANLKLLHAQLELACFYQDYQHAREITAQAGFLWHSLALNVWDSFSEYYQCKTRAEAADADQHVDLHLTIRANDEIRFAEIIENHEVDIDKKNIDGETALFYSLKNRYYNYAFALIANGADVSLKDNNGVGPIHKAAQLGVISIVKILLEKGVSANSLTSYRWTPLHYAIRYGHDDVAVELLKQPEIDINIKDTKLNTPLHIAAGQGSRLVVDQLLRREGVKVNVKNRNNKTPLNLALEKRYNKIARLLMENEAISSEQSISQENLKKSRRLVEKGITAHNAKKYEKARKLYLEALEFNPNDSYIYGNLALVDIHLENFEACYKNTQQAIEINPRNSHAIYSAAQCLFMLKKPRKEYLPFYRQYIALEPNNYRTDELLIKYPELSVD